MVIRKTKKQKLFYSDNKGAQHYLQFGLSSRIPINFSAPQCTLNVYVACENKTQMEEQTAFAVAFSVRLQRVQSKEEAGARIKKNTHTYYIHVYNNINKKKTTKINIYNSYSDHVFVPLGKNVRKQYITRVRSVHYAFRKFCTLIILKRKPFASYTLRSEIISIVSARYQQLRQLHGIFQIVFCRPVRSIHYQNVSISCVTVKMKRIINCTSDLCKILLALF